MKRSTLILGLVVCLAATVLLLQWQSTTRLRVENQSLTWQLQQMKQFQPDTQHASNLVAEADTQPASGELLRLRSEVTMLRQLTNEIAKQEQNYRWIQESPLARESNNFATWLQVTDPDATLHGTITHVTTPSGRTAWEYEGTNSQGNSIYSISLGPQVTNATLGVPELSR